MTTLFIAVVRRVVWPPRATEAFALRHFSHVEQIPDLYQETKQALILQRIEYPTLVQLLHKKTVSSEFMESIGVAIGSAYAAMAKTKLSSVEAEVFSSSCQAGCSITARMEAILTASCRIATETELLRPFGSTLGIIRKELDELVRVEPVIIYKYDNNFTNMLIDELGLAGIIDFEMSYLGTESILLGAMLDTIPAIYPLWQNRPQWSALVRGYCGSCTCFGAE